MRQLICKDCGKVIEGYTINHADSLMKQHKLYCKKKLENKKEVAQIGMGKEKKERT